MLEKKYVLLIAVTAFVIVLDQWTKYVMLRELTTAFDSAPTLGARLGVFTSSAPQAGSDRYHFDPKRTITVIEGYFQFEYAENPGAAFGLFRTVPEGLRGPLFHLVSIGAVILILHYFRKLTGGREEVWALSGLPLVLGGAVGNYLDRLARGFVIDFLGALWHGRPAWPTFNVADSAICVGVGLLVIDSFVRKEKKIVALEPSK
jgi:signal peptidase II